MLFFLHFALFGFGKKVCSGKSPNSLHFLSLLSSSYSNVSISNVEGITTQFITYVLIAKIENRLKLNLI